MHFWLLSQKRVMVQLDLLPIQEPICEVLPFPSLVLIQILKLGLQESKFHRHTVSEEMLLDTEVVALKVILTKNENQDSSDLTIV